MQDKTNSPIFITGIERSGSSIVAKIMHACGAFIGDVTSMQENIEIKKLVEENYYPKSVNCKYIGQYPLPDMSNLPIFMNWKQQVNSIISQQGYTEGLWMYKSSKLCQTWQLWNYAYPNAKWIIVRRRTGDIIHSCLSTAYMAAFKNGSIQKAVGATNEKEGWLWWVHEHEKLFVEMIEAGLNCKVIWPERMVTGDYQQLYETLDWLGLPWKSEILIMVEPLLYKSRQKERSK